MVQAAPWDLPYGPSDSPFDPSFWYITKSMGFPEGTRPGGYGVPLEDAELVLIKHAYDKTRSLFTRKSVGAGMVAFGSGVLVPGPFDVVAAGAGVALVKHPAGAALGVAAYNALGVGMIATGTWLMTS